jgi:flagellar basal-body rod protein FlgB
MFQNLEVFRTSYAMARHSGARQAVTAANMANADTPGYRAQKIASFADSRAADASADLRTTRSRHVSTNVISTSARVQMSDAEASPNGNSVSLEQEMLNSVEIQREHNRALAIYKHSLDILRVTIGRK